MASSLQSILNTTLGESGFGIPTSYVGSGSPDDVQMVYLANAAALSIREDGLQELRRTGTITLSASESYALPSDFLAYIPDTAYLQGRLDPVDLPTTPPLWQQMDAAGIVQGLQIRARFMQSTLRVLNPIDGAVLQFEYISNAPWTTADTVTPKEQATLDSDLCLFDFRLMVLATKWRWKKEKGLADWQIDQAEYARQANMVRGRSHGAKTVRMGWPMFVEPAPYTNLWIST